MSKSSEASQAYLRFLNLLDAIRGLPTFPTLDPVEERVLSVLAASWAVGTRVTVLQAMERVAGLSPSTVHRRLKTLRAKGMVALAVDEADHRTRYVVPTELSQRYFAKLGQCLDQALRPEAR